MIIDAHQHFWSLRRGDYPWPNDTVAPIFRDFGPGDLAPLLAEAGVDQTVVVQATDTVAETEFLLNLAQQTPFVAGVVGWVDLADPDAVTTIERLRANPLLKGLRPMLQNIADTQWILDPALTPALAHMAETGLRFDALIQPRHLPAILQLAERHPDLQIVIDHVAKPAMGKGQVPDTDWMAGFAALAQCDTVWCKLSGMVTEVGPGWTRADITPFAEHVLDSFGPRKTIFGSDWPVVNLASDYKSWIETVRRLIKDFSEDDQQRIMGSNARQFYQL
ncbi:amidohydrolase family protein [Cognatishimia maritima]|uniref:L-fuconolactonase n=1 Tax=Cognatishimia maritima TaxID=870908 RepID=A0A1M5QKQ4_9RHOB|nr:amidohydrolase family protein [Cognatishimia maritima]SHH14692.1 L-fuconolactonase [Cognatishimia maritima]